MKDRISISRTSDVNAAPGYQNFVGFTANGVPVFSYYNVNKARIQGVETELKIPFNDEWKLSPTTPTTMVVMSATAKQTAIRSAVPYR